MLLAFEEIAGGDVERLAAWLPQHRWPYHGRSQVDEAWVRERVLAGDFFGAEARAFWVKRGASPVGVVRVFELSDITPLLDIRIGSEERSRGVGTEVVRWVTAFVFEGFPDKHRLGGYTRADNLGMRRVFEKCGFVQEAHHRQAWRVEQGAYADAVGYAVLRSDWLLQNSTPAL